MKSKIAIRNQLFTGLLASTIGFSCAQEKAAVDAAAKSSTPANSQGKTADIQLKFASSTAPKVALGLVAGLDIGSGVMLSDARVNIGKIKIKPEKLEDEDEKNDKDKLKSLEKENEAEMKDEEAGWEAELNAIEKKFEAQKDAAKTDAEKATIKANEKSQKAAVELKIAAAKKVIEDKLDALEAEKDGDMKWKESYVYDLIQNTVSPKIPTIGLFDGNYRRIEFELKPNRSLASTDPLLNSSVYIAGTVLVGTTKVPFTYALDLTENFKLTGAQGANMEPEVVNSLVIAFKPSAWFTGIDFSTAVKDGSGTILIDKANNLGLYSTIKKQIKSSAKFGKDDNDDGELEDSESDGEDESEGESEVSGS